MKRPKAWERRAAAKTRPLWRKPADEMPDADTTVLLVAPPKAGKTYAARIAAEMTPHTRYVEAHGNSSRRVAGNLARALGVPSDRDRIVAELRRDDVLIVDNVQSAGLKAAEFVREVYDRAGCGIGAGGFSIFGGI